MSENKIKPYKVSVFLTLFCAVAFLFFSKTSLPEADLAQKTSMENNVLVSVILPTYNREDLLPRALDSILQQTYPNFELIVINDGSSDRTQQILEEYAAKDQRIKIIKHEQNKGLVTGLNEGLEQAKGEYIARMDDDDVSYPKRLEKQLAYMEAHPEFAAVGSWVSPIDSFKPYVFQQESNPERIKIMLLLGTNEVSHPALMLRSSFIKKHHIRYKNRYKAAEDRGFYADIMFAGGKMSNVPETLLHYRLHRKNTEQYYETQQKNIFRFQQEYLKKYFDIHLKEKEPECYVSFLLMRANKKVKLLDQQELKKIDAERCRIPTQQRLILSQPNWYDVVGIKGTSLVRAHNEDRAMIVYITDDELSIKWEHWGTETYKKQRDGHYELRPETVVKENEYHEKI